MAWNCSALVFRLSPVLHADKCERAVAGSYEGEQAETRDGCDVLNAGRLGRDLLDFGQHLFGP